MFRYVSYCLFGAFIVEIAHLRNPCSIFELMSTVTQAHMTRYKNSVPLFNVEHDYFYVFPSTVIEWNKLDSNIRNSESIGFHKTFLKWYLQCHNLKGLKLIARLRLDQVTFNFINTFKIH